MAVRSGACSTRWISSGSWRTRIRRWCLVTARLIKKEDLLPYRAMLVDILAKVKTLRNQGQSLPQVLAANLTAPYDKTTQGDTQQSKDRFITEVYDEVKDFPRLVDGKRTMPKHQ